MIIILEIFRHLIEAVCAVHSSQSCKIVEFCSKKLLLKNKNSTNFSWKLIKNESTMLFFLSFYIYKYISQPFFIFEHMNRETKIIQGEWANVIVL